MPKTQRFELNYVQIGQILMLVNRRLHRRRTWK